MYDVDSQILIFLFCLVISAFHVLFHIFMLLIITQEAGVLGLFLVLCIEVNTASFQSSSTT